MPRFEGNELLALIERLRGSFFHRLDGTLNALRMVTKTANYSAAANDQTILADPSSGDVIITMVAAALYTYRTLTVKRIVATSNRVYVIGSGLETVEAALYGLYLGYSGLDSSLMFQSDGTRWRIVANYGTDPVSAAPVCDLQQPAPASLTSGVSTVAFGSVVVGASSAAKVFTIKDTGIPNLGITSAAVATGNPADFPVDTSGMAAIIAYNGTTTFSVTFTPLAAGARSTTLSVTTTAGVFTVSLTGTGYDWLPWIVFVMSSTSSGAQSGVGGENGVSWFNREA